MPYLLRVIRKSRWFTEKSEWHAGSDYQSDCLGDLATQDHTLCLWQIEDDFSNLNDVLVALAANRDRISNLDYAYLKKELVNNIGELKFAAGDSPYSKANILWHYELTKLSAFRLIDLAKTFLFNSAKGRMLPKDLRPLLLDLYTRKELDIAHMKDTLRRELGI